MKKVKTNYMVDCINELGVSMKTYIKDAEENYVALEKDSNTPLLFNDGTPMVFGSTEDVSWDDVDLITERDFILRYCKDYLENLLKWNVENRCEENNDDMFFLKDLNGVIDIDGMTDILNAHVGCDGNLSFLISDNTDSKQTFVNMYDLSDEVIFEILMQVLK